MQYHTVNPSASISLLRGATAAGSSHPRAAVPGQSLKWGTGEAMGNRKKMHMVHDIIMLSNHELGVFIVLR